MSLAAIKKNNPISRLSRNIKKVSLKELIYEVLKTQKHLIEDLNAEQLSAGKRSDGSKITPKYSPEYAKIKKALGFETKIVNLKLEGDYHKGITAKVKKYEVEITNTDWKDAKLSEKYGAAIIGLSTGSIKRLNMEMIPEIRTLLIGQLRK